MNACCIRWSRRTGFVVKAANSMKIRFGVKWGLKWLWRATQLRLFALCACKCDRVDREHAAVVGSEVGVTAFDDRVL
jgi:hypothetical protein